jgi:hypothetical protein
MLVCHGWQNIGDDEATIVSMPSRLYDYDAPIVGICCGILLRPRQPFPTNGHAAPRVLRSLTADSNDNKRANGH